MSSDDGGMVMKRIRRLDATFFGMVAVTTVLSSSGCIKLDSFLFDSEEAPEGGYDFTSEALDGIDPARISTEMLEVGDAGERIYVAFVERDETKLDPRIDPAAGVTVLYNYGNRFNLANYWHRVGHLEDIGFNVVMYDYRGYGASEGESSEENIYQDAGAVYDFVTSRGDVGEVFVMGYSMGGGPAIWLASPESGREVAACILDSPFASTDFLFDEGMDYEFEGQWLLDVQLPNETRIATVEIPVMLTQGTLAQRVAIAHGEALWAAARDRHALNRHFWVEGAGHRTVPIPSYTFDEEPKEYSYPDELPQPMRAELAVYQSRIVDFVVDVLDHRR